MAGCGPLREGTHVLQAGRVEVLRAACQQGVDAFAGLASQARLGGEAG